MTSSSSAPPREIAGFRPFAVLSRRHGAATYKAFWPERRAMVLLKVLAPTAGDADAARFAETARLLAGVDHPNVAALLASGEDETGRPWIATAFVDGQPLDEALAAGPLPPALAAFVGREALAGLAAAHAAGALHRDLKPANFLLSADGRVVLVDFGFASTTEAEPGASEVRGTPGYLAPELVGGAAPSAASDLFALGCALAEAATGRPAFPPTLDAALHHDAAAALAQDPRLDPALAAALAPLLASAAADRPPSADAARERWERATALLGPATVTDLAAYLDDPTAYVAPDRPATPPDLPEATAPPAARPSRVRWMPAVLLALVVVGLVALWPSRDAAPETERPATSARPRAEARSALPDDDVSPPRRQEGEALSEGDETGGAVEGPTPPLAAPPADASPSRPAAEGVVDEAGAAVDMPLAAGALTVTVEPWAHVEVDGARVGTTPLRAGLALPPGEHAVVLRHPDFPDYRTRVVVLPGGTAALAVSLWDTVGRLSLDVRPWAVVSVDGVVRDTLPPQRRPLVLAPGTHRLRLEHPALGAREADVRVAPGEARTLRFDLTQPPDDGP